MHTQGAAGPSGVDAYAWRRLCSSFQGASTDLCNVLAKYLYTANVYPDGLVANFLEQEVRPIGYNPNASNSQAGTCQ